MAKLSNEAIAAIISGKGYSVVDISEYKNLKSPIIVRCANDHEIKTDMETFRNDKFYCPKCEGINPGELFLNPKMPPAKKNYRIVAFDQATEKMGVSIYDDGKLAYYDLMLFTGDTISRLVKIKYFIENVVIKNWQPDLMVFEDIQQQHGNVATYKVLAGLLTICCVSAREAGIDFEIYLPGVGRSGLGINKAGNRSEEKKAAIMTVYDGFGVKVQDDTAEAILIGKFASMNRKSKKAF